MLVFNFEYIQYFHEFLVIYLSERKGGVVPIYVTMYICIGT